MVQRNIQSKKRENTKSTRMSKRVSKRMSKRRTQKGRGFLWTTISDKKKYIGEKVNELSNISNTYSSNYDNDNDIINQINNILDYINSNDIENNIHVIVGLVILNNKDINEKKLTFKLKKLGNCIVNIKYYILNYIFYKESGSIHTNSQRMHRHIEYVDSILMDNTIEKIKSGIYSNDKNIFNNFLKEIFNSIEEFIKIENSNMIISECNIFNDSIVDIITAKVLLYKYNNNILSIDVPEIINNICEGQ